MAAITLGEDDPDIRELIAYKLERGGHTVEQAENGVAALEAVRRSHPNLVILDIMMPDMSGLEVCRALRNDPATAEIPVILLTARAQEHDVETGFEAGAHDYMIKPFSVRELASRVAAVLGRAAT